MHSQLKLSSAPALNPSPAGFIRAVVWDVDGTLLDSEPLHYEAVVAVSESRGCTIDVATNESLLGVSLAGVWHFLHRERGLDVPQQQWMSEVVDYYLRHVSESLVRPGVWRSVQRLSQLGIPQVCVSTAERKILTANLRAIGVLPFMRFTLGFEDVAQTKPAPDPYLEACRRLGVPPADCLAVEDTEVGVESAHSAGLRVFAWPSVMSQAQNFCRAHQVIQSLDELPWALLCEGRG